MYTGGRRPHQGGNRRRGRRQPTGGMAGGLRGRRSPSRPYYSGSDSGGDGYDSQSDESGTYPGYDGGRGFPGEGHGGSSSDAPPGYRWGPTPLEDHEIEDMQRRFRATFGTSPGHAHPTNAAWFAAHHGRSGAVGPAGSGFYRGGHDSRDGSPGPMGGRRGMHGGMGQGMGGPGGLFGGQGGMAPGMGGRMGGRLGGMAQEGRRHGGRRGENPGRRLGGGGRFGDDPRYGAGAGGRYMSSSPPPGGRMGGGGRRQGGFDMYGGGGAFPDSGEESW